MNDRRETVFVVVLVMLLAAGISALSVAYPGGHHARASDRSGTQTVDRM